MKRFLLLAILFILLLQIPTSAAIGSKGLIIEGGIEELVLEKGEKEHLFIQDGRTRLPLLKNVSFFSDNRLVATVGLHSGVLRANQMGSARIFAISDEGHAAILKIRVTEHQKGFSLFWLLPIGSLILILYWFFKRKSASG